MKANLGSESVAIDDIRIEAIAASLTSLSRNFFATLLVEIS
jgi:hypothetical protein